jgi:CheY-like chemotaxis protein
LQAKYRALALDDEPALLEIVKIFIEEGERFDVTTVSSVREALHLLSDHRYDVIISDYQMPGEDGIQFLKALRSNENSTPFILFTGKGREDVAVAALNNGADFYVRKGGDVKAQFAELENAMLHVVRRKGVEQIIHGIFELASIRLMIVDQDRCVHAFNKAMAELVPHNNETIEGIRCGVLFGCDNSKVDERGCGFSPFCKDCKVWAAVDRTIRTGESCINVKATIPVTKDGRTHEISLVVSTTPIRSFGNDLALMYIEDVTETFVT